MSRITSHGKPYPLGATIEENGVNFSVFSPHASLIELLLFDSTKDTKPEVIPLFPEENKSYNYWHIMIPGIGKNQLYGYRVYGAYNKVKGMLFDPSKVLVDPYAKCIVGKYDRQLASIYGKDNIHSCLKSAVIDDNFNWNGDYYVQHDLSEAVVYELHLSGFTKNPNSGLDKKIRGTYKGLIEKIPYLKSLGITSVELLPVFAFDEQDAPESLTNYWGYSPINFFAVHSPYASTKEPQEIVNEFKTMICAFHKANIEVILDVVYNHTTENDAHKDGPTLSLRGFSNRAYYMIDESGNFRNYTGTGNTLNANHSVVRRMIRDSLNYWVREMHIDGFRFDLASVLSRNESGEPIENPPILWSIDSDPILAKTKIIAEPWDASGLYQVNNFAGDRWIIWNDNFRDTVRQFVKGTPGVVGKMASGLLGSPNQIKSRNIPFAPKQSLHFVSCHDGFTMNDLVSYTKKQNLANLEQNRDGHNHNYSWNCGAEGETDDAEIEKLREKQIRNFFAILLLSHGSPMLSMGDEVRRTQKGNNNAYCQDNAISWMDWDLVEKNKEILKFVSKLIKYIRSKKTFAHKSYYSDIENNNSPYVNFHGINLSKPDWSSESRSLAMEIKSPMYQEHFYIILNMYWKPLEFELPKYQWEKVFDTEKGFVTSQEMGEIICPPRTVLLLRQV